MQTKSCSDASQSSATPLPTNGLDSRQEDCKPSSVLRDADDGATESRPSAVIVDFRPLSFDRLVENFAKHLDGSGGYNACWLWTGTKNSKGYGVVGFRCADGVDRRFLAHRIAWMLDTGQPLLPEIQICHHCDVRLCCNRRHMFAGSNSDNVRDAINKGRRPGLQVVTA